MTWLQTYTGRAFDYENPTPDMVCIEDVAHALAHSSRFNGHASTFFSIAQHSILVSQQLPSHLRLQGLLHDAHEAYVGDVVAPLKRCAGMEAYCAIERRVQAVVAQAFGIPPELDPKVREADLRMLISERNVLFGTPPYPWGVKNPPFNIEIQPVPPLSAKLLFLTEYRICTR